tara:strand:+ start:697 stop:846 length:150 start_codon:yes stop_codon:yes gene_type:complete
LAALPDKALLLAALDAGGFVAMGSVFGGGILANGMFLVADLFVKFLEEF